MIRSSNEFVLSTSSDISFSSDNTLTNLSSNFWSKYDILSTALLDGAPMNILSLGFFNNFIKWKANIDKTVLFPVPGGPWINVNLCLKQLNTAFSWLLFGLILSNFDIFNFIGKSDLSKYLFSLEI